eukprot:PhM_4_TR9433/c0_g1_i1/m.60156/K03305/TC.POT; proton-dependent oligopeptide transporter, POT family
MFPASALRIVAVEFNERFAFYSVAFTFATIMQTMLAYDAQTINVAINVFYAVSAMASLGFAVLADMTLGLKRVLLLSGVLYALSLASLTASVRSELYDAFPHSPTSGARAAFWGGMMLMAIAYGGVKTTTAPLLASQITDAGHIERVFRLLYWTINAGSLAGILSSPALCLIDGPRIPASFGSGGDGGDSGAGDGDYVCSGYWVPYTVCFGCAILAVCVFGYRTSDYTEDETMRKESRRVWRLMWLRMWGKGKGGDGAEVVAIRSPTNPTPYGELIESRSPGVGPAASPPPHVEVLKMKRVGKLVLLLPVFWVASNQQATNYVLQATWLQRPAWVSPSALNSLNSISLLTIIPVLDYVFHHRIKVRPSVKVITGFVLSALGLLYAGGIQYVLHQRGHFDNDGNYVLHAGSERLSVWYQVPLYVVQSVAEALSAITLMEMAYTMAPKSQKSLCMALYLMSSFVSSLIGLALVPLSEPSKLHIMFVLCSGLMFAVSAVFAKLYYNLNPYHCGSPNCCCGPGCICNKAADEWAIV